MANNRTYIWKKVDRVGGYILGIGGLLFIVFVAVRQTTYLWLYARYTIAIPTEIYFDGHLTKVIVYKYKVGNKTLERQENFHGGIIGKRYYVKFSYKDPKVSDFLEDKPVPDSITNSPTDGWLRIPNDP